MTTPDARIAVLERYVVELTRQNAQMAEAIMSQSVMLGRVLQSLFESSQALPGEQPIATKRHRAAKAN